MGLKLRRDRDPISLSARGGQGSDGAVDGTVAPTVELFGPHERLCFRDDGRVEETGPEEGLFRFDVVRELEDC